MVDGISLFEFVFETVFILRIETEPHFRSKEVSVTDDPDSIQNQRESLCELDFIFPSVFIL